MSNDHENGGPNLKSTVASVSEGMMASMAPLLVGSNLPSDEARAWDDYTRTALGALLADDTEGDVEAVCSLAVEFADELIKARRQRFNIEGYKKHMVAILAPMIANCGEPIGSMRCILAQGHEGKHSPVASS